MAAMNVLDRIVTARYDPRPMALLRIILGLTTLLCGVEAWGNFAAIVEPGALRVPFAPLLEPMPARWLPAFIMLWLAAAALLTVGLGTRVVGTILVAQLAYTLLVDQRTYSNHLYLLTLEVLYLVLGDAGAAWSVDAWLRGGSRDVPGWPITLWKWQISIVYFFAAAAKINPTFLQGEVLANYWPTEGWLGFLAPLRTPAVLEPLSWGAVAAEFFLAGALWLRSLRRTALVVGLALHAGMVLMISQKDLTGIIAFALVTLPPYLLFFVDAKVDVQSAAQEPRTK